MKWIFATIFVVCFWLLAQSTVADDFKVGDKVVVIDDAKLTIKSKEVDDVFPGLVLSVAVVKDDWIWVSNGIPGWLDKKHVVPLNKAAIDLITKKIEADPKSDRLYYGRAEVWRNLGEIEAAVADMSKSIELKPSNAALMMRAILWQSLGKADEALADLNKVIETDPKNAYAYSTRAAYWIVKQDWRRAIADATKAIKLDPKDSNALIQRGIAWESLGEEAKALADFDAAIAIDANSMIAYRQRGELLAYSRTITPEKTAAAIADCTRACNLTNWKDARCLALLAAAYASGSQYDKAVEFQIKAVEFASASERDWHKVALTQYKQRVLHLPKEQLPPGLDNSPYSEQNRKK